MKFLLELSSIFGGFRIFSNTSYIIFSGKRIGRRSTHTIELEIQNVTNRLNTMCDYYESTEHEITTVTQLGFIPGILYLVEF